ncbi:hypothetical protein CCHR01_12514 [Colletotrichum chrysophilum]|uniref:Uncharacterized protein n=1 Tax=Colletotrichum chrysophilum TaxID=1836956 RepID=A0AAD9EDR4_9PEZI|nr:hypothetical protein CCHR01_12514 [Colletotrichum chrysophilum]
MAKAAWAAMEERREGRWETRGEAAPMARDSTSCPCRSHVECELPRRARVEKAGRVLADGMLEATLKPLVPGAWPSSEVAEWKIRFIGCLMPSPLRAQGIASQPSSSLLSHPHAGLLAGTFAVCFCAASSSKLHIPTQHSKKNTAASLLLPSTGESTPRPPTTGAEEPPTRALLAKQYEALAHDASEAHDTSSATVGRSP